ncbi:MAG TPA: GntR family transcriptional regulator [Gaiellaceae bacterium]|nr:GntR family transcriptional regulator [Gaiellaceae bacterium]
MPRRQQVLEILRSEIMTGRYEPGERLIEATISEELGTSRGPVREALRQLEHEGLVDSIPYRGAVVLDVSDEEVQEVLIPIRLTLESFSFGKALGHMGEADFAELAKQLWLMEEGAKKNDLQQVVEADLAFHEVVIAGSGRHTMQVWRSIWPRIRSYFIRYGRFRDLDSIVEEHTELLGALRSRDRKQMMAVLERHIAVPVPSSRPLAGKKR